MRLSVKPSNTAEAIAKLNDAMDALNFGGVGVAAESIRQTIEFLTERLRMESAKSVGAAGKVKILDKIGNNPNRAAIDGAWLDEAGRQCVTDGYRAFRFYSPLPLRELDTGKALPVELSRAYGDTLRFTGSDYLEIPLSLVDSQKFRAELKKLKALNKAAKPAVKIGEAYFNASYFMDMLSVFPAATLYVAKEKPYDVAFACCPEGDALLLPIRPGDYTVVVCEFNPLPVWVV